MYEYGDLVWLKGWSQGGYVIKQIGRTVVVKLTCGTVSLDIDLTEKVGE